MSVNGSELVKVQAKGPSKIKPVKSFEWDEYLKLQNGVPAPIECFNQPSEPPVNEFRLNQKLELNSPTNDFDFVHLATVVGFVGPRLQLRLDGCDSSNDIFELVDSQAIHPVGARFERKKYFAAPLRFRKDAASYNSFCKSALKNAEHAPKSAFKKPPQEPRENLFQQGMKLEAVDQKHPSNICPATIVAVDRDNVTIHLDGWDDSNDYKCSYKARVLFPVGWCKKTGYLLQKPGPKADIHTIKNEGDSANSNLKTEDKEPTVSTAVKATTSTAGEVKKKESQVSVEQQQSSNVNKSSVVSVTSVVNQTQHPKNTVLNNKNEAKLTTPKPLTGSEGHANSSAPTGAKLVNEPPKIQNSVSLVTTANPHKVITTTNMTKLPSSALSSSLPQSLHIPSTTSAVAGANIIRNPSTTLKIPLTKALAQGATVTPIISAVNVPTKSVNSNNSNNIHISPKRNNIGEQIKQQQQQLHQQQQPHQMQQQQQFIQKSSLVLNGRVIVTQSSLQMNNNTPNNNRGIKRALPPMNPEQRKSQAMLHTTTTKPVITQNNSTFHSFNRQAVQMTVVPNPIVHNPIMHNSIVQNPIVQNPVVPNSIPIIMPQQYILTQVPTKAPVSQSPTLAINDNNVALTQSLNNNAAIPETSHNVAIQTEKNQSVSIQTETNQVPVVNGCKKTPVNKAPEGPFPNPNVVKNWTEDELIHYLGTALTDFGKYESLFRSHEIDGKAFLLLTNDALIKFMNIKLGYSLKICNLVNHINGTS